MQIQTAQTLESEQVMLSAAWNLTACGPDGNGPFRLVLYYAHGSVTEYFHDVAKAFCAIEAAEKHPGAKADRFAANRLMIEIPGDVDLVKQFLSEEAWANGARH